MAQDKFRRLLTKELSNMSERSKSGHQLAEWVQGITGSRNGQCVGKCCGRHSSLLLGSYMYMYMMYVYLCTCFSVVVVVVVVCYLVSCCWSVG